jgi:4-hydroxy-3-polyprenylbenzoate decarboxylase
MERARRIWEELGLPSINPESPWHGYSLGDWNDEWDQAAARAAAGDWMSNGRRTANALSSTAEPQDPARGITLGRS